MDITKEQHTSAKEQYYPAEVEEESVFSLKAIFKIVILYWYWFILSTIFCAGAAYTFIKYVEPVYSSSAKLLIKEENSYMSRNRGMLANMEQLGMVTESYGVDNEQEILRSSALAQTAVRNLNLNITYAVRGSFEKRINYKNEPITLSMENKNVERLNKPISIKITKENSTYNAKIEYFAPTGEFESEITASKKEVKFTKLPASINTRVGIITLLKGKGDALEEGQTEYITVVSPRMASYSWAKQLDVAATSKMTSVVDISITDVSIQRSVDYLRELIRCYNKQANDDKNEKAELTESFIANRLANISEELSKTDDRILSYKETNKMVDLKINAESSYEKLGEYEKQLADMDVQTELINSLMEFARRPNNEYQVLPSNIGLEDQASTQLISQYNSIALERNRLLTTASANSPWVIELTEQLKSIRKSIDEALTQNKENIAIQREGVERMLAKSMSEVGKTPEQERFLTQIGRQQYIQQELYLTLLQKREENLIQLASTADKAKVIEQPRYNAKVSPRGLIIMLIGLMLGLALPVLIIIIRDFFHYKVEGREELRKLTTLPVIADIAVANEKAKERGDVVVKKNTNNQMAEIFRGLRSNIQFMLPEGKNKILFTSSISGEGKTFVAANLAVSFALLDKKVVMVGLDIRRPRLANLFKLAQKDTKVGISALLTQNNPTWEDIQATIVSSEVNKNLDLLMAGPIPPNPAELLERKALETIIDQLAEHYDYVVIDTAPIGLVTDTVNIAKYADVTIYVCRADYTPKECISMLNDLVAQEKLSNVSVVLNGIDMSKRKNAYSYGYGKYGQYGKYGRYGSYTSSNYGSYGHYQNSNYGDKTDRSVKR